MQRDANDADKYKAEQNQSHLWTATVCIWSTEPKMKMLALTIVVAIFASQGSGQTLEESNCTPGDKWADGKIKMQCTQDGQKPIGE